jgi:hypothetical protein
VCLTACSEYQEQVTSPEIAEALALRQGRPIGRGNGATALGPPEIGAPAQAVTSVAVALHFWSGLCTFGPNS